MAFIQDPRMRQRWNEIQHTTETVTENAAAGIWTFQHRYITPCLASICASLDSCTGLCLGDREERARRARERDRGARRSRAEYTFDFYDDWDDDLVDLAGEDNGILGSWGGGRREDWDRLLAGTGSVRTGGETVVGDQPRRKRGMSYGGTRTGKRKLTTEEDPTVIPSTAPLGFLGRLPFKIGGTLRYKPSAANLKEHAGHPPTMEGNGGEHVPLLGSGDEGGRREHVPELGRMDQHRTRSNTAGSGATSDSYRSRNDLFPSDGEGDEDAIPLDDEFAVALDRVDTDRGSNRTKSSKGKRPMSRTVSRTTIASSGRGSLRGREDSFTSIGEAIEAAETPRLEDLRREEEDARREEEGELERRRGKARELARARGLSVSYKGDGGGTVEEGKDVLVQVDGHEQVPFVVDDEDEPAETALEETKTEDVVTEPTSDAPIPAPAARGSGGTTEAEEFIPARLPYFR